MNTNTDAMKDQLSITVLSVVLGGANVLSFWLVNHYTDVFERIF